MVAPPFSGGTPRIAPISATIPSRTFQGSSDLRSPSLPTKWGSRWGTRLDWGLVEYLAPGRVGHRLRAGPAGPAPPVPAAAAALPSVEVHRGYLDPEFAGPDAARAADTEFFQKRIRGRGAGRKPNDVLVKIPDWEGGSRIDRTGLTVRYTRVLGATDRRLREELERNQCIHLCRSQDCPNPTLLHCKAYAAADSEALVGLGAYGRFGPWRAGVLLGRLDSEAEVVEDPCQAVQVGLELHRVLLRLSRSKTATPELPLNLLHCLIGIRSSPT